MYSRRSTCCWINLNLYWCNSSNSTVLSSPINSTCLWSTAHYAASSAITTGAAAKYSPSSTVTPRRAASNAPISTAHRYVKLNQPFVYSMQFQNCRGDDLETNTPGSPLCAIWCREDETMGSPHSCCYVL